MNELMPKAAYVVVDKDGCPIVCDWRKERAEQCTKDQEVVFPQWSPYGVIEYVPKVES